MLLWLWVVAVDVVVVSSVLSVQVLCCLCMVSPMCGVLPVGGVLPVDGVLSGGPWSIVVSPTHHPLLVRLEGHKLSGLWC
jgi:hypothetical protein